MGSAKAKKLSDLELTTACKLWVEASTYKCDEENVPAVRTNKKKKHEESTVAEPEVVESRKEKKKRCSEGIGMETPFVEEEELVPRKEKKKIKEVDEDDAVEDPSEGQKKKARKEEASVPFRRVDAEKWREVARTENVRLLENDYSTKQKYGEGEGDLWVDKAAGDLGKVKGKGFRKEMMKKKRASWKGAGEIDQGVNSLKFDDSDDDEA